MIAHDRIKRVVRIATRLGRKARWLRDDKQRARTTPLRPVMDARPQQGWPFPWEMTFSS
jgi:hypothetical protein